VGKQAYRGRPLHTALGALSASRAVRVELGRRSHTHAHTSNNNKTTTTAMVTGIGADPARGSEGAGP